MDHLEDLMIYLKVKIVIIAMLRNCVNVIILGKKTGVHFLEMTFNEPNVFIS